MADYIALCEVKCYKVLVRMLCNRICPKYKKIVFPVPLMVNPEVSHNLWVTQQKLFLSLFTINPSNFLHLAADPQTRTLSLQQRWVQQLHHVLDLRVQLRHVTLSHNISQHGEEVIGSIHPAWKEADSERWGRWVWCSHRSDRGSRGLRCELQNQPQPA